MDNGSPASTGFLFILFLFLFYLIQPLHNYAPSLGILFVLMMALAPSRRVFYFI